MAFLKSNHPFTMKSLLILSLTTVWLAGSSQNPYSILSIPDSIRKKANVVKRVDQTNFRIVDLDKVVQRSKVAYTIFNEAADKYGFTYENYDKLQEINLFDATLYDALGNKVRSVKRNEVKDESAVSGISLMEDSRVKWFNFFCKEYPYTVEFEIETESKNTMFFPTWSPIGDGNMGVMQSSLTVRAPKGYNVRYKLLGGAAAPKISATEKEDAYHWEIDHYKPLQKEPYAPSWYELTPTVIVAPSKFVLQGYEGDMNSWESFGKFRLKLNAGRDELPQKVKQEVQEVVNQYNTPREKAIAIYKYLQQNTRYISVQMGIGGWQPFDAKYVAEKKYGDCKALSNYMTALLKSVDIPSYYAVIKAGPENNNKWFLPDFTNNSFNHIIVCVPLNNDTLWLECTDQNQYPGYMGDFTDNRYAFLITPEGGKLAKTPRYGLNENLQTRRIDAKLAPDGALNMTINTLYQAQQQDWAHGMIKALSKEKVTDVLKQSLDLPNYELLHFDYKTGYERLPIVNEALDISALNYAQVSGKRIFVTPNIMSRSRFRPTTDSTRAYSIKFEAEYRETDTVNIALPEGYKPESMPKDVDIKSAFGNYKASVKIVDNKLVYTRLLEKLAGTHPPSAYPDLVAFWDKVHKADRAKVVMVKPEQ
ncbi:MAG: DUF3857 domain-containing protein [Bacteroidetes bacterium]|nr:MAG: DUF3857 domain-containing protein [Bacteroidota bacterium]